MARDRGARPEEKPLRLFVAVTPPPEGLEAVERSIAPWRERLEGARWERAEKMHFTLKFLGRTFPRLVGWVEEVCRSVASEAQPFDVQLAGLGVFPSPGRTRVLWAGVDEGAGSLVEVAAALDEALAAEIDPERRPFTPHLTVARFRTPVSLKAEIDGLRATPIEAPPFPVEHLTLVRSHLMGPEGSRYETLAELSLGSAR